MGTRTNYFIQKILDLLYLNTPVANIGDANGLPASAAAGSFYAALLVNGAEADYGSYARVAIPRSAAGFARANNVVSNVAQLNFPKATAGNNQVNRLAIYDQAAGGNQLHVQDLANPITVSTNVQPIVEAGALTITGS
ncbi:MAG TPA: hypothetical protein VFG54_12125 [Prolixibacteraceae bacterium]|nr:hypothetical protein [Prolixibacteraceae bacterium]